MKIPFTIEELDAHIRNKTVRKVKHPTEDLWILNYTPELQKRWEWDNVTIHCRGLIVDKDYNIVARPFSKFFTVEQLGEEWNPPDGDIELTSKIDGSLGILYWIKDIPFIASRGSFTGPQALKATEMLHKSMRSHKQFQKGITYLFEIVYPENKIVVDYGAKEELVLLAKIDIKTGETIPFTLLEWSVKVNILPSDVTFIKALSMNIQNEEGFVCRFLKTGQRVKIKNEWYKRMSFFLRFIQSKGILKALKDGTIQEYFTVMEDPRVPAWINKEFWKKYGELRDDYDYNMMYFIGERFKIESQMKEGYTRKDIAEVILTKDHSGILFGLLDGKDCSKYIWMLVEDDLKRRGEN
jgi:RNA ligase